MTEVDRRLKEAGGRRLGRSSRGAYRMLGRDEEEILTWLRLAHAELGDDGLTVRRYRRWRQAQLLRWDQPIPTVEQLERRWGCFGEAARRAIPDLASRGYRLAGPARVERRVSRAARRDSGAWRSDDAPRDAPRHAAGDGAASRKAPRTTPRRGPATPEPALPVALVAMLDELSPLALRELERVLRHRTSESPSPSTRRRVAQLSFLAELLARTPGRVGTARVSRKDYEAARPASATSADVLQRAYGSWLAACRAADGLLGDGTKRHGVGLRGPRGQMPIFFCEKTYVIQAVLQCAKDIGRRPSSSDYHLWVIERRARLRAQGRRERLPGYGTVLRLFGNEAQKEGVTVWSVVLRAAFLV